ncbi:pyrrolidone-carboxylate peptidase [Senna tora]|uniref:Pyrrolidone-carboxylate peptidase n=1 Tax=Senna tora TaxID=362788 RepID=A0A834WHF2_9FABA|nr:pyrrolidone-carboxylate peptidase [Senna tora]
MDDRQCSVDGPSTVLETHFRGGLGFYDGVRRSLYSRLQRFSALMETITKRLKKRAYDVIISDDVRRFVYKYVYYNSVRFAEQHGNKSLFVHVPIFFQN